MAKAPNDSRIPVGGRIPMPRPTNGAVRRTLQNGLLAGSRLLPSKIKLPILKPINRLVDMNKKQSEEFSDNQGKKAAIDTTYEKIPALPCPHNTTVTKDSTFTTCDKIDPEKNFNLLPDLNNKVFETGEILEKVMEAKERSGVDGNRCDLLLKDYEISKLAESIGKKVTAMTSDDPMSVNTVTGILRYVGHVQTDDEMWCGLETEKYSFEYHDGSVNGVKYFSCKNGHGLLVPATYVILQCQNQSIPDPKILELRKKLQYIKSNSNKKTEDNFRPNAIDITQRLVEDVRDDNQCDSGPYSLLVVGKNTDAKSESHDPMKANHLKLNGYIQKPNQLPNIYKTENLALIEDESMPDLVSMNYGNDSVMSDRLSIEQFRRCSNKRPSMILNCKNSSNPYQSIQYNEAMIEDECAPDFVSYGCDSTLDSNHFESLRKSVVSERRLGEIACMTPPTSFVSEEISRSTPLLKDDVQNDSQNQVNTTKTIRNQSPNMHDQSTFVFQPMIRKQNADHPPSEDEVKDTHDGKPPAMLTLPSPTVSDNSIQLSKQNSFDESLGILTPEQMNSLSFLENVFTPSTDDFVGMLNSDKITEKTESCSPQTPTEIIKSLTPDGIQMLLQSDCRLTPNEVESSNFEIANKEIVEKTLIYEESNDNFEPSENLDSMGNDINMQDDTYEMFVQRPFAQSTVDNLSNCKENYPSTVEDELLPSVHSSILDAFSSRVDTTRFDNMQHVRMDQTPSPEELPLDPVDIKSELSALSSDPKTDNSKSVTYSITSITSLDGYQGDGEMSRPVSRGADQSPTIGHRVVNNIQNWQNIPINRRPDPMTDSDFFTESDADGHDEQIHRGDRRAQVIDGALYGGGKASNPPVLVSRNGNNDDSCMESSGVFTDMETHRCSPLPLNVIDDMSPEGSSASTRSDMSQNNNSNVYNGGFQDSLNDTVVAANAANNLLEREQNADKTDSPQAKSMCSDDKNESIASSTNALNDKMNKEDKNMALKKYKMPRRDVGSKVKTFLNSSGKSLPENQEKPNAPKKEGRWDAVMNKISVNKSDLKSKSYLKDVKSKVNSSQSSEKTIFGEDNSMTSNSKPKAKISTTKLKSRRAKSSRMPKINMLGDSSRSTPRSSQSDLSVGCSAPPKITSAKHTAIRAAKKRDGVAGPVRPLSPPASAPANTPAHQPNNPIPAYVPSRNRTQPPANGRPGTLVKKSTGISLPGGPAVTQVVSSVVPKGPPPPRKPIPRRAATQLSPRVQPLKDQNRASSPASVLKAPPRAGSTPSAPPVSATPQTPPTRDVEALAVLVQYLVFQLDALNAPRWKAQATEAKAQLAEAAGRLQRAIATQRADHNTLSENINRISSLENELKQKSAEYTSNLLSFTTNSDNKYKLALEESTALKAEIRSLKATLGELKNEVAESKARVVRAEDASRRNKAERATLTKELKIANNEVERLRNTNKEIEKALAVQQIEVQQLRIANETKEIKHTEEFSPNKVLNKDQQSKMKDSKMTAEIDSLKTVLEMKMGELGDSRKKCEEYRHAAEQLPSALQRVATLTANIEDLRSQLSQKSQDELNLVQQNKLLQESFSRESAQKNQLLLHNEELRYKLQKNSIVTNYLASKRCEQNSSPNHRMSVSITENLQCNSTFPGEKFVRGQSRTTASFNEKYLHSTSFQDRRGEWRNNLRRTARSESCDGKSDISDKNNLDLMDDELSPPNSPKIKGVVEKNDSVSYVLEIEETAEEMASRLVRRAGSFRVSTSPPTREAIKRQRSRPKGSSTAPHSLSQSASASCIDPVSLRSGSAHCKLFRSNSIEHNQYEPVRSLRTSTPTKNSARRNNSTSPRSNTSINLDDSIETKHRIESREHSDSYYETQGNDFREKGHISSDFDGNDAIESSDLALLQEAVPKESAGEALISGSNSEDDSSLDERSHSSSDNESPFDCEDKYLNGAGERLADPVLQKIAETMDQESLSATPMDVSWSEDGVIGVSESDI